MAFLRRYPRVSATLKARRSPINLRTSALSIEHFYASIRIVYTSQRNMATAVRPPRDPNTLSNYHNFRTTHTTANFEIRFDQQQLVGNVIHQLKSMTDGESTEIILDSSYLDIHNVKIDGKTSKWELLPRFEPYGSALKIALEEGIPLDNMVEVDVGDNRKPPSSEDAKRLMGNTRFRSKQQKIAPLCSG